MAEIVIIADDLTGAADSAAACMSQGLSASVVLHSPERREQIPASDVLSIDPNTRCLGAEQAAAVTSRVLHIYYDQSALRPRGLLFKKLDSTLRGHFAAELAAMLTELRATSPPEEKPCVVMAPALPSHGRTTVAGIQMLHGQPVHQAGIPALLSEAGLSCRTIETAMARGDSSALQQLMLTLSSKADVLLCDAESDEDLHRIAVASMVLRDRALWAGSAGMAAHLPLAAGIANNTRAAQTISLASGPTLFVVGSFASVSREQANVLSAAPGIATFHVQTASVLTSLASIIDALQSNRDALLVIDEDPSRSASDSEFLTRAIAQFVTSVAPLLGAVVATGGETARTLLDALGIGHLRLLTEVEAGIPFSVADTWTRPLPVITKAGAFGSRQSLLHCREFLQALDRSRVLLHRPAPSVS